jgi:hypothetical protein
MEYTMVRVEFILSTIKKVGNYNKKGCLNALHK